MGSVLKEELYKDYFELSESSPSGLFWKVNIYSGTLKTKLEKSQGSVAGIVGSNGRVKYWKIQFTHLGKTYYTTAHEVIWILLGNTKEKGMSIDHIDGDGLNNKILNLRYVTTAINSRNRKRAINNSSGHTGVYFQDCSYAQYWTAVWREKGKNKSKCFRISTFGYDKAKELAIIFRETKLKESKNGWTERHGK